MSALQPGSAVHVRTHAKGPARDDREWVVWSAAPKGWWVVHYPDGGRPVIENHPTAMLKPAREVTQR